MKHVLTALIICLSTVTLAKDQQGAPLTGIEPMPLAKLLAEPASYTTKTCAVEGKVVKVCEKKGCWLSLEDSESKQQVRMAFKDYGFFVGQDIIGKTIRAEGNLKIKELSEAEIAHLKADGAEIKTKQEVSFVAAGLKVVETKK